MLSHTNTRLPQHHWRLMDLSVDERTPTAIDTPLNRIPMKFVDARVALDEYQKWEKLYDELFRKAK